MSDPRELLDAYAAATHGEYADRLDEIAPQTIAALRAVLDLHRRQTYNAPVRSGSDTCRYCDLGEPTRIDQSFHFVTRESRDVHTHERVTPNCEECSDADLAPWPCATVQAITSALEGT